MSEDGRLAQAAARGDAAALEELIRRLAGGIYRFLLGMLGETGQADEALQETFVMLTRSLGRLEPDPDVDAWAYGVARRVAADIQPGGAVTAELPAVLDDVRRLPVAQRELVVLRDMLDWPLERLSPLLGLPADEIPKRLLRAREMLLFPATSRSAPEV